jgi:UrcA family protein
MAFKSTILLCLAAASVATAYAEPEQNFGMQESATISVKRVNFNRPDEVAALYRRISYAADRVCGPHTLPGFHFESPKYTACYDKAVDFAVASLDRPELTTYYQERECTAPRAWPVSSRAAAGSDHRDRESS